MREELNYDGNKKEHVRRSFTCSSATTISKEEETECLKESYDRQVGKLLRSSWWQIIKRERYIKRIRYCNERIRELTLNKNEKRK